MVNDRSQQQNNNIFYFIDNKSIENRTIFMTFDTYIMNNILDYFENIGNNVYMIKENSSLNNNLLDDIRFYRHLISYNVIITSTNSLQN